MNNELFQVTRARIAEVCTRGASPAFPMDSVSQAALVNNCFALSSTCPHWKAGGVYVFLGEVGGCIVPTYIGCASTFWDRLKPSFSSTPAKLAHEKFREAAMFSGCAVHLFPNARRDAKVLEIALIRYYSPRLNNQHNPAMQRLRQESLMNDILSRVYAKKTGIDKTELCRGNASCTKALEQLICAGLITRILGKSKTNNLRYRFVPR